jgi:hypothetical protein
LYSFYPIEEGRRFDTFSLPLQLMDEPELDLLVVNEMGLCGGHSSIFFLQLDYYAL